MLLVFELKQFMLCSNFKYCTRRSK